MFMNLFHRHYYYECDKQLKYYSSTSCPCVMLFSQTSTGLYYVKMYFLIHVIMFPQFIVDYCLLSYDTDLVIIKRQRLYDIF